MTKYSPAKTGEYPRIFFNFENCACCQKELKDNKHNSPHLGLQDARIFVLGHYLFLVAHSFPRAALLENGSLLRKDHVPGQISWHIFTPNGGYCLFIINITIITVKYSPSHSHIGLLKEHHQPFDKGVPNPCHWELCAAYTQEISVF